MSWLGTWKYRRKITISNANVDAILSNFPILVKISASSGTGSTDITDIFTEIAADGNRQKIAVTTSDGTTQCYVEIERWDHANSLAWLWVKVPSVASGSVTELYIYYDVAQADNTTYVGDTTDAVTHNVWDSNFKLVMHMAQDPNGDPADAIKDSTGNVNHGTPGGSMTTADLVDGKIGKGIDFDGSDDCISIPQAYTSPSELTWEVLFKSAISDTTEQRLIAYNQDTTYFRTAVNNGVANQIQLLCYGTSGGGLSSATSAYNTTDHRYIVGSAKENDYFDFYVDEAKIGSSISIGDFQVTSELGRRIGADRVGGGEFSKGILSECRISTIKRTTAWIKATYYSNWDELVSYGVSKQNVGLLSPLIVTTEGISNIKVNLVPGSLSALSALLIGNVWNGFTVKCLDSLTGNAAGQSNLMIKADLSAPLAVAAQGVGNIQISFVPGSLSALSALSVEKVGYVFIVQCLEALAGNATGQSNLIIKTKAGALEGEAALSVDNIFNGFWINLVDSLTAVGAGESNIKIDIKPVNLEAISTGQSNIKVDFAMGTLSAILSLDVNKIGTFVKRITKAINSSGEQSQDSIPCALGFEAGQLIKMDLSLGVQQLQSLLQRLCQGDPFVSLQSLINKLVHDKRKVQGILNVINSSLEGTQSLLQQICEGDPFVSLQSLKNKLVDDKHKVQKIFSTVASSVEGVQSLLQQICKGDPFVWFQSLKNKLADDKRKVQKILNTLTSSIEGVQSLFQSISLGDPFISLQSLTNKLANDKRGIQGAINTITASIEGVQSLLQQLCKGDPFISTQLLENKLADDKRGLQKVLNTITSSVEGLQSLLQQICEGDPFTSMQSLKNKLADDKHKIQGIVNTLTTSIEGFQPLLQQICEGDPFISLQSLKNKLTDDKRKVQGILNVIAGSIEGIQPLLQSMSLGDVASLQKVLSEIADKDFIISQQKLLQTLQGLTAVSFPAVEYDVLLDGISIKNKIDGVVVNYREDSVHNSIEIQSADCDLFWDCDPVEMEGTSRIEISVGTRQIYFLLEKRAGDEQSFSIWGRSLSAREDSPYAEDLEYSLVEPKSAKSVVEEILTISSLNWQCDDWTLPSSFEFEGVPIDGITQIVTAIGGVVRCEDDGTICVRQKFPVRPVDMDGAVAEVNYDRKDLTKLSYDHIKGTHYNAIEVIGCTDDVDLPDMLVEESAPEMGDDVHIRVYWAGEKPSGIIETYVTDGKITSLGEEVEEEEEAEVVAFEDGVASVSKPITSVVSVEWIGDSGGEVTCDKYSKDLEIGDGAYRVAKITYKTTYSRYRLDSHDVEMLLALLTFGGESDVSVLVKMGEGDRPASDFYGSLLTSESIAVVTGTAWLDANRYDYKKVKLETPYNDSALDGALTYVNDAKIDCIGNFHIESSDIIISGPKVINELEVVQCQV